MSSQNVIQSPALRSYSKVLSQKVPTKFSSPHLKNMKKTDPERKVRMEPIDLKKAEEVAWLHLLIQSSHSAPKFILPTKEDLKSAAIRYFRAFVVTPKELKSQFIGVSSYEVRTPYLAETQKTIILPEFRGGGWGKVLSQAIEDEVKKAGFYKVRSCIYSTNLPMIQIKLAQGYIIEGYHPDHDGPGLHEYSLGKVLRRPDKDHPL